MSTGPQRVLVVKLSSLGDVVHTMPAVQDIRHAYPEATIDWVVEPAFAPLLRRCEGVSRIIPCAIRRWRKAPLSAQTRSEWQAFRAALQTSAYDAVIDLQGLTKSALVAWMARTTANGQRYAMANRTDGSGYEAPTRWVADRAIRLGPHVHAVQRSRQVCAEALHYPLEGAPRFGLHGQAASESSAQAPLVALVHGTSRQDKTWPQEHWVALGQRLQGMGLRVALVHGTPAEEAVSRSIAQQLQQATLWPLMALDALVDRMADCQGVIGVDSGLSHIAVALDLAHVQIYNFDTAWRTGVANDHQTCVYATPHPSVDAVWAAWQQVWTAQERG